MILSPPPKPQMSLFSFRHSVKTFSDKRADDGRAAKRGQTAAHLKYITRPQAARVVLRERLTCSSDVLAADAAEVEAETRKGRVCERFIIALPIEATPDQRRDLVRAFCEAITRGVAGYVAAIHDQHGNDIKNPHAHIVAFDVQQKGGGRGRPRSTIGMARKNAVEETAALWAATHNRLMAGWGYGAESQISHLSYAARGIERIPTIHEGATTRQMCGRGAEPSLKSEWRHIDSGHSRAEANAIIREINTLKQEIENDEIDSTHRLGSDDERNRGKRQGIGKDGGAHGFGDGGSVGPDALPWAADCADGVDDDQDGRAEATALPPFASPTATAPQIPPFAPRSGLRGGRGIRRIFRELVMLRDTLQALLNPPISERAEPDLDAESAPERHWKSLRRAIQTRPRARFR